ncbi:MAG: hypothetical protein WB676_04150 [Bryobacteraceae bacterium]
MRLPLSILHIFGGTIGLLSGSIAIAVHKGNRLHRASGNVFTVAMLTLASSGLYLAILKSQRGNIIGSIVTFYLITTAWLAGRRRGAPVRSTGRRFSSVSAEQLPSSRSASRLSITLPPTKALPPA